VGSFPATRFTPSEDFPRRQPYRITAAVALLPLPSLSGPGTWPKPRPGFGTRLAEAARGLSRPALRGAWSAAGSEVTPDSMMLRSAEADPHVIERMRLPRRRGVAWATRAEPPQPSPAPRRRRWLGRSSHRRGWSAPTVLSGPLGHPKVVRGSVARPKPRDAEGRSFHPPRRAEARARRTSHGAADFRALLHRRVRRVESAVASGTTLVPSMGFVPLQGSFGFRFDPAVPSRRETVSAEPRFGIRGARARLPSAANRVGWTCNRDPFPGSPPSPRRSAGPGRRQGAEAESRCPAFSARPRNPRWRVLPPPLDRSRG
jgi:hypothetical protein